MRTIHRFVTLFVVIVTLYLGTTGTLIQLIDLRSVLTDAPADDPNMEAMRESTYGPGAFQVISNPDYTADALPGDLNLEKALNQVLASARNAYGEATLGYVEMRMAEGRPVAQIKADRRLLRFDAITGEQVVGEFAETKVNQSPDSERNTVKRLHRMTSFGDWALWINVVVSVALAVLIVTGIWMYFQLKSARARTKRSGWFWSAGGWWRSLHRWISVTSAAFLVVVALSGAWLAVESLGMGIYMAKNRPVRPANNAAPAPRPILPGGIAAFDVADAPNMLRTTLAGYQSLLPDTPIRVVRLRVFGGMQQGVIVTGEPEADQVVFNAVTGTRASMSEPGYPEVGFPFGWEAHQIAKKVHRGDYFGMSGRWADLFAGLAMIYLSISGVVMYFDMWKRRRGMGRRGLVWK